MALPTISMLATTLANGLGAMLNTTVYSSYTLITAGAVTTGATVYFYNDPALHNRIGSVNAVAGQAFAAPGPDLATGLPLLVIAAAFGAYRYMRKTRSIA